MTPLLETTRLRLVPVAHSDVPALFEIARVRESIEDFQHQARTEDDVLGWLSGTLEDPAVHSWTIRLGDKVIGFCEIEPEPEFSEPAEGVGRTGYFIDVAHQGKGYGTEALRSIVDWGLADGGFTRIEAGITAGNRASERILEKVGFEFDHIAPDDWEWRGETYDSVFYVIEP